jgi:hypothetical protein
MPQNQWSQAAEYLGLMERVHHQENLEIDWRRWAAPRVISVGGDERREIPLRAICVESFIHD